jgi:hypothetical protein
MKTPVIALTLLVVLAAPAAAQNHLNPDAGAFTCQQWFRREPLSRAKVSQLSGLKIRIDPRNADSKV